MRLYLLLAVVGLVAACALPVDSARAQRVEPWTPPWSDSVLVWSANARAHFKTNTGDTLGGTNYRAYELVGFAARRMLRALGKDHMLQAGDVAKELNANGLDTHILVSEDYPIFALLMVRNPFSTTAQSVGFLYWFLGDDLRIQGAQFHGGEGTRMKVWWTGHETRPYSWAIIDRERGGDETMSLMLLHMSPDGHFWTLSQYEGKGPYLGSGEVAFADINSDETPELLVFNETSPDSSFDVCDGCPQILSETIYVERDGGFDLHDSRLVPTPFSTFVLFVRLLRAGDTAGAGRMLIDPSKAKEALALDWGADPEPGAWKLEATETGAWPRWLRFRYKGPRNTKNYTVKFAPKEARWLIDTWREEKPQGGIMIPEADSSGSKPPR